MRKWSIWALLIWEALKVSKLAIYQPSMILDHLWNWVEKNLVLWEWVVLHGVHGVKMGHHHHLCHPHHLRQLKVLGLGEVREALDHKVKALDLLLELSGLCV